MNPNDNIQTAVDRYLDGTMVGTEKADFEQQMQADETLAAEVQLQKDTNEVVMLYGKKQAIRQKIEAIAKEQKTQTPSRSVVRTLRPVLAVAAMLTLFFIGYFLLPSSPTNEQLFADNFAPYQDVLTAKNDTFNLQAMAMKAYNDKQYGAATNSLKKLYQTDPENTAYQLYLGISLLGDDKPIEAIHYLEKVSKSQSDFSDQAEWYLALAHLANKDSSLAKAVLTHIAKSDIHDRKKEAKKLLEELK